jgi:hypothetical protein
VPADIAMSETTKKTSSFPFKSLFYFLQIACQAIMVKWKRATALQLHSEPINETQETQPP